MLVRRTSVAVGLALAVLCAACSINTTGTAAGAGDPWSEQSDDAATAPPSGQDGAGENLTDDPSAPGQPGPDGEAPGGRCDLTGLFAVQWRFPVAWDDAPNVGLSSLPDAGEGEVVVLGLGVLAHSDDLLNGTIRACGIELPEFRAGDGDAYGAVIDGSALDAGDVPLWTVQATTACADPGCAVQSAPSAGLLGVQLDDPMGPWPASPNSAELQWLDPDRDGARGVSAELRTDAPYTEMPIDGFGPLGQRATALRFGLRAQWALRTVLQDCDTIEGPLLGGPDMLIAGCAREQGECSQDQAEFLSDNLPRLRSLEGAVARLQRLDSDGDCADVRALFDAP